MRRVEWLVGLGALFAGVASALSMGACTADLTSCDKYAHVGCPGYSGGTGGGTTTTTTTTPPPAECGGDPTAPMDTATMKVGNIRDECAVFVRADSSSAAPDGSMENPYKTLKDALMATSGSKPKVFACDGMPFSETVTVGSAVELYGGFDCTKAQWTWKDTGRTELDGKADAPALTIQAAGDNTLVSGWKIVGAKASVPMMGGSSIGVAVDDVATMVTIKRSDISAANAEAGADGTTPTAVVTVGAPAPSPVALTMNACGNPAAIQGGAPGTTTCGAIDTSGGAGGKGGVTGMNAGNGAMGANGGPTGSGGQGGAGQTDLTNSAMFCAKGQDVTATAASGTKGSAGSAATLSLTGVAGGVGGMGGIGTPGLGGGGGGGAKSGSYCPPGTMTDGNGASGGGGGAGGCGGNGGNGGLPGGSSFAVLSVGKNLTIDVSTVTLTSGDGGKGGVGANGQAGATGGAGGAGGTGSGTSPSKAGCAGGAGGTGGDGGPGGGGRGGFSAGVVFGKSPVPALTFTTKPTIGAKGNGGMSPGNAGNAGAAGAICDFSGTTPTCM